LQLVSASATADYCDVLEQGNILYFPEGGYRLPDAVGARLMGTDSVEQDARSFHKNIAYKPAADRLSGLAGAANAEETRDAMRQYSSSAREFLARILPRYSQAWKMDYASFRSLEEEGRELPLTKRNDLLHVDAFPTRPVFGDLILRCFTNVSPQQPRRWMTSDPFAFLAEREAAKAGLARFARKASSSLERARRSLVRGLAAAGVPLVDRSPYDAFMLSFHDWLKRNRDYQENCPKYYFDLPPGSTWLVFTDIVPHAVLGGRFAVEQTMIVSRHSLLRPERAPASILERLAGRSLTR
jgi:hypothetical protein